MKISTVWLVVVGLFVLPSTARPSSPDPGAAGPYAVGHTSFTVVDPSRDVTSRFHGRPVFASVWYPVDAPDVAAAAPNAAYTLDPFYGRWSLSYSHDWEQVGMQPTFEGVAPSANRPFPVVVISPGWGARYVGMFFYGPRLASHGFVVAVLQHYRDSIGNDLEPGDTIDGAMANRPLDVSFVVDALAARNDDPSQLLFGSMLPDRLAVMGHSLGGYAAMVLAGGDDVVCGSPDDPLADACVPVRTTAPDPRVTAIVPLDGSSQLLHFSELARIAVPSMAVGEAWEQVGDWQARQHAAISGHPNYRADVINTVHASFGGSCAAARVLYLRGAINKTQLDKNLAAPQCTGAPPQLEVNRLAAKYAIAFLKTHLAGEPGYQHMLTPGWALTREPDVEFFVTERRDANAVDEDWPGEFVYFPHQSGSTQARASKEPKPTVAVSRDEP